MSLFAALFKRNFLSLFWAQFTGSFNDNLFRTAFVTFITYQIIAIPGADVSFYVTAALAIYFIPYFLFAIPAGEIADKYSKTVVIKLVKLTEIFTVFLIVAGFKLNSPGFLLFVLFVMGTQGAFFGPVKYSIMPQILTEKELLPANALMEAGRYTSILLGSLLGGAMIAGKYLGTGCISLILGAVALFGFTATLFFTPQPSEAPTTDLTPNIFKSIWRNLSFVYHAKDLYQSLLAIAWFWVLGAVLLAQLPELSANVLHVSPKVLNHFFVIFTAGISIGALLSVKLLRNEITLKYTPLSTLVMSLAFIDLAFTISGAPHFSSTTGYSAFLTSFFGIRISLDLLAVSLCGGFYIVPFNALLQKIAGTRKRTAIIATSYFLNAALMVIAMAVSAVLVKVGAGVPAIISALALTNFIVALYISSRLPDYVLRSALFFILESLYDIEIKGMENYEQAGKRTVIVANNNSFLDPLLLAAYLPDDITFVVDSNVAKRFWVRIFLRFIKHIPVDPTNAIAVKTIIDEIKKGRRIILYPEGRMSTTGSIMKIYPGPAMIIDKANAEVLPIFMQGTQYSRLSYFGRKLRRLPSQVTFCINILPPQRLNLPGDLKGHERRYKAEDKVYDLMTDMKFKSSDTNTTLFRALLEAADLAGSKARALEDINRKGLGFSKVVLGSFLLGKQFTKLAAKGEFIGLMLPNMNVCAVSIFALLAYGRVPAMINFSSGTRNILSACRSAALKKVITSRLFIEKGNMQELVEQLGAAGIELVYLEDISKNITWLDKLQALLKSQFPYRAYKATNPNASSDAPAVVLFTSGSEGVPKGVVLSHRNINANRFQLSSVINYGLQDKFFNALPMFHSFGLVCGLFMPLLSGAGVFLYPTPLHYKIIPELVYDRNATVIFGTDTFLNAYGKAAHPYDFYNIKYAAVGAEKLRDETFKLWSEKFGIRVLEAYGATETAPGISFTTPMHYKRGTVGRIFPGLNYKLEHVPGIDGPGDIGRLIVKGDNVMLGYLTEANPGVIVPPKDGWYDTGDIVSLDNEGFISIVGRAKRFAKIAGEMVSLSAVEGGLSLLWPDFLNAVVRLPDEKRGEQLMVYTTNPNADLKQILEAFRRQGFSDLWAPKKLRILEEMPLMGSGKIDYVKLDEMASGT